MSSRNPQLLLAPASARGWFGGRGLSATRVVEAQEGVPLAEAAAALQAEFEGSGDGLTAVLATYGGECTLVRFARVGDAITGAAGVGVRVLGQDPTAPLLLDAEYDLSGRAFRGRVQAVRERIVAGDVYVLNLTARLSGSLSVESPDAAFDALQARAGADMAALLTGLPGAVPWIASASPERFLRVRRAGDVSGDALVATIEPIKGTRPRGATPESDALFARELAEDVKERAEHVMVVDLERNDLGTCCVPGSVAVDPLYEVVTTPYCHQLVSSVHGALRPGTSFAELFAATFPCGSVTGAPKRAAMRIIAETEATPRGAYCGALLVALPGELDSSVLIRTLEGTGADGAARWGAGAGITHDSDPAAEYLETLLKASPVTGDGAPRVALRETMRVVSGEVPLFDRHLARLASGGTGPSVLARVRSAVREVLDAAAASPEGAGSGRLGVTVTPDGAVAAGLTREPSSLAVDGGPRIALVEVARVPELPQGAAKPASRRHWDRAHRAARLAGADQAVLHTTEGTLVDGSTANVWLVAGGVLVTPPAPPAVAGVARGLVFDIAARLGVEAREKVLTVAELEAAEEVWLSNGYGGFVPTRGRGGPVGERVAEAFERVIAPDAG